MKTQYKTHQRTDLIAYLRSVEGQHVTAADVCDCFRQNGKKIGMTTVYRHLEKMVDEGLVKKYIIDGSSPACFEYTGERTENRDPACFHCKCEKCGKLIHLRCEELEGIGAHLGEHHGFFLNPMRTVFYGLCEDCVQELPVSDAAGAECPGKSEAASKGFKAVGSSQPAEDCGGAV